MSLPVDKLGLPYDNRLLSEIPNSETYLTSNKVVNVVRSIPELKQQPTMRAIHRQTIHGESGRYNVHQRQVINKDGGGVYVPPINTKDYLGYGLYQLSGKDNKKDYVSYLERTSQPFTVKSQILFNLAVINGTDDVLGVGSTRRDAFQSDYNRYKDSDPMKALISYNVNILRNENANMINPNSPRNSTFQRFLKEELEYQKIIDGESNE